MFKKWIAVATLMTMTATSVNDVDAQEYYADLGGVGYQDSVAMPCLTPYIVLVGVTLLAIVVMAVRHHNEDGHAH